MTFQKIAKLIWVQFHFYSDPIIMIFCLIVVKHTKARNRKKLKRETQQRVLTDWYIQYFGCESIDVCSDQVAARQQREICILLYEDSVEKFGIPRIVIKKYVEMFK